MVDDLLPGVPGAPCWPETQSPWRDSLEPLGGSIVMGVSQKRWMVGISWKIPIYKWMRTGATLISGHHHVAPEIFTRKMKDSTTALVHMCCLFGFQVPVTRDLWPWNHHHGAHEPCTSQGCQFHIQQVFFWFCWDFPSYKKNRCVIWVYTFLRPFQTQWRDSQST